LDAELAGTVSAHADVVKMTKRSTMVVPAWVSHGGRPSGAESGRQSPG